MPHFSFHHRFEAKLSYFKASRLVFERNAEQPDNQAETPEKALEKRQVELLRQPGYFRLEDPKAQALIQAVQDYNQLRERRTRSEFQPVKESGLINFKATLKVVEGLLKESRVRVWKKEKMALRQLEKALVQALQEDPRLTLSTREGLEAAQNAEAVKAAGRQLEKWVEISKNNHAAKEHWRSTDIYKNFSETYDSLIETPEFADLKKDMVGQLDVQRAAENRALFLALMEQETSGFKNTLSAAPGEEQPTLEQQLKERMTRFLAAVKLVDYQENSGRFDLYPPQIRRMIIQKAYERGQEGGVETLETTGSLWTIEQLRHSPFFNKNAPEEVVDANQKAVLELAYLGGEIKDWRDQHQKDLDLIKSMASPSLTWEKLEAQPQVLEGMNVEEERKNGVTPQALLNRKIKELEGYIQEQDEFLALVQRLIQAPYTSDGKPQPEILNLNEKGKVVGDYTIEEGRLSLAIEKFSRLEPSYQMLDRQTQADTPSTFETMGMDLSDTFSSYQYELEKNPSINIDQWDELLKNNPQRLADILQSLISPPQRPGAQPGREYFLTVLRSLDQPYSDPEISRHQAMVIQKVAEIKGLIEKQSLLARKDLDASVQLEAAIQDQPKNIKESVKSAYRYLANKLFSGDPFDMALAGGMIFVGASLLMSALKSEKTWLKWGTIAGIAGLGGAAIYEDLSGKTFARTARKLGPSKLEEAAQNTAEMALVNYGEPKMKEKDITREETLRAKLALRKVPFHKVMDWYNTSDTAEPQLEKERFQALGISLGQITPETAKNERSSRVKNILRESIQRDLEYVAQKREKSPLKAKETLEEIYVKAVENKHYLPQEAETLPPYVYERFHGRQNELTYGIILKNEVDFGLAKEAMMKEPYGPVVTPTVEAVKAAGTAVASSVKSALTPTPEEPREED